MAFPHRSSPGGRALRFARVTTPLVVAGLLLTACSGDGPDQSPDAGPGEGPGGEPTAAPVLSPLTGQPFKGDGPDHPVLAVKIDNSSSSRPQVGLAQADMVAEELVEGGITRLAVFFHRRVPETVGPVRSMRATDIGIVTPLDAVLVASGGAPETVQRVDQAGIVTVTEGAAGYYRESSRSAPYNLFMRLRELAGSLEAAPLPPSYLPFGDSPLPAGRKASGLTASFSRSSATTFEYRDGGYVNTDTNAGADDQFVPRTVLVLRVQVGDAGYRDPAGNPVPETLFTGQGPAMIFHGGRVIRGTWTKNGLEATVRLSHSSGPLQLPPGKVWIELVPVDGGAVTVVR